MSAARAGTVGPAPETKGIAMNEQVSRALALCGIEVPVYQAGLGGVAGPDLAAAVSEAGGLGHLGCIRRSAADVRLWIRETRKKTGRPFGVNLTFPGGGPDGFDAQLSVVLEERPKVLSLFWGDFSRAIPRAKAAGIVTMVQVGSVAEARKAAQDGADIVIAQGIESGGHVRGTIGLMALLPAVIEAVAPVPVLAAGGIADADAFDTVLRMGAAGAWVGTRFVASHESLAHDIYKQRLVAASTDDTYHGHFYSFGWRLGTPYRAIRSKEPWNPLQLIAGGARRMDAEKYARNFSVYGGQGVDKIHEILSAREIVQRLLRREQRP
jgi:NAD(P)H-dependent flavin oxidoreductase YrpB (nitropropane dioxygenase family)